MEKRTRSEIAELIRLKYKYRRLVMKGKLNLPPGEAALLIGPDCAYHLYSTLPLEKPETPETPEKPAKRSTKDEE